MTALLDDAAAGVYVVNMARVGVDLSAEPQRHVDARAVAGRYADPASYLRALVEQDQAAYSADVVRVQGLIDAGLASGICEKDAIEVLDEIITGIREPHG